MVGAKRVRHAEPGADLPPTAESADALVDVGITLTHGGRIITGVDPGEIDQGQADWRQDVLAVPPPGMLIREQTARELGGLDPDLPAPWAEIDLCQRVWRSGERVAVQSAARILHPHPTRPVLERLQDQRTGRLLTVLKHRSLLHAPLTLLLLPLETLLRMAGALAATAPRTALMEPRAVLAALPRMRRVLRRGARDRRRARVPRRRLAPLYLPRGASLRRWLDDVGTRLFADDDRRRQIRRTTWGIAGTRHGLDDADYGRHIVWTAVVVLGASILGLFSLRSLFGRGELAGAGLRAVPEAAADRWAAAWSTWVPGGLGDRGPGDPLVRLLGHLPGARLPARRGAGVRRGAGRGGRRLVGLRRDHPRGRCPPRARLRVGARPFAPDRPRRRRVAAADRARAARRRWPSRSAGRSACPTRSPRPPSPRPPRAVCCCW
ncbi:hypothetical protein [Brachybacterium sp. GPGPB12]|uniref:glycosyltransferase family 2 protein n=1 Tax=Brachybacterium sp. GPGPB12 TaxID=3023517 RepID=UPI0031346278